MKRSRLTAAQHAKIRKAIALRRSLRSKELARKYGVSPSLIQAIAVQRRSGLHG